MTGAAAWDARFGAGEHAESDPDPFLVSSEEWLSVLPRGASALDLACGAGRHAAWLAQHGFQVTAVDFSSEALHKTQELSSRKGLVVSPLRLDLETPGLELGGEKYDLICGFFFLHRPLFPALREAVKRGGFIIYKTYTTDQRRFPGRPRHPMHLLEPNELLRLLQGFRVLRYEETWQGRGTAAILAQRGDLASGGA